MTRPCGFASSAKFEDARVPASMRASASSTASGSSFARKAALPPISVSVPDSSSAAATRRTCWPRAVSPSTSRSSLPSSVSPPTSAIVSDNLRLRFRGWGAMEATPQDSTEANGNAASHVDRHHNEQHRLGPVPDPKDDYAHYHENQGRARTQKVEVFEAPIAPCADHQE